MSHIKGKINIPPVEDLLQRSVDNIRLQQIQQKVNLEAEIQQARKMVGSPLPAEQYRQYLINLVRVWQKSKPKFLW